MAFGKLRRITPRKSAIATVMEGVTSAAGYAVPYAFLGTNPQIPSEPQPNARFGQHAPKWYSFGAKPTHL